MILGIQADDLTGACDTGAPFAARGLRTLVALQGEPGSTGLPAPPPDVVVLDTESRALAREAAAARALAAARTLAAARPRRLYKKLDSTLRGHAGAELAAVLDGVGLAAALVAPAFPGQARMVVDGVVRIGGRPADEGPLGRDPAFPRTGASVLALLADAGVRPLGALPLPTARAGAAAAAQRLARFLEAGGRALVADAETDGDLLTLAEAASPHPVLLAGSAGLAGALAATLGAHAAPPGGPAAPAPRLRRPLLVVAGSLHPATRAQLERLGGREGIEVLAPPAAGAVDDPAARRATAARLAADARDRIARRRPGVTLATGGDTAVALLRALGGQGLRLAGQVEPGLALGTVAGGPFDGLVVATKAGGFGDADTLVRLWEAAR
jgi:uncharacterized protein YgbK (DUF1537 family)